MTDAERYLHGLRPGEDYTSSSLRWAKWYYNSNDKEEEMCWWPVRVVPPAKAVIDPVYTDRYDPSAEGGVIPIGKSSAAASSGKQSIKGGVVVVCG